jgi:hypothetical protein
MSPMCCSSGRKLTSYHRAVDIYQSPTPSGCAAVFAGRRIVRARGRKPIPNQEGRAGRVRTLFPQKPKITTLKNRQINPNQIVSFLLQNGNRTARWSQPSRKLFGTWCWEQYPSAPPIVLKETAPPEETGEAIFYWNHPAGASTICQRLLT